MKICDFDIPASVIAFKRAWRDSVGQFVAQVGHTVDDVIARTQEIRLPQNAYFNTPIERRINPLTGKEDLYWQGYRRSIDESMRRNIALLVVRGESQEKIDQAKAERQLWQSTRDQALGLNEGEAIRFFGLRTINPEEGISLQQLSMRNGQLVLESLLLPFAQADQIDNFRKQLSDRGKDISLPNNGEVNLLVLWAVQGAALDFKQDAPEMVEQAMMPAVPEAVSLLTPAPLAEITPTPMSVTMPVFESEAVNFPVDTTIIRSIEVNSSEPGRQQLDVKPLSAPITWLMPEPEVPVPVSEPTGFWFEAMAAAAKIPAITETPVPGIIQTPCIVEAPIIVEVPTRLDLEGQPPEKPIQPTGLEREVMQLHFSKPTESYPEGQFTKIVFTATESVKPTKPRNLTSFLTHDRGLKMMRKKRTLVYKVKRVGKPRRIRQGEASQPLVPKVPQWEIALDPLNDKETPFWQISFDANEDLTTFVLTMFWLILNTKWLQPADGFSDHRGSGRIIFPRNRGG